MSDFSVETFLSKSQELDEFKGVLPTKKMTKLLEESGMGDPPRSTHVRDFFRVSKEPTAEAFAHEYQRMVSLRSILALHRDFSSKEMLDKKVLLKYFSANCSKADTKYIVRKMTQYLKKAETDTISLGECLKWYQYQFHLIGAAPNTEGDTKSQNNSQISGEVPAVIQRNTKIVATLGPASNSIEMLRKLVRVGVNVFRLNFSHAKADYSNMAPVVEALEQLRRETEGTPYKPAILADLQGPKFRTGELKDHKPITLEKGQSIRLVTSKVQAVGDEKCLTTGTVDADVCVRNLEVGHRVMINDGAIVLRVTKRVSQEELECEVVVGGVVSERKGINTPELTVPLPALTAKDKRDCKYVCEGGFADFVALSFVQRPEDVTELIDLMEMALDDEAPRPKIICKIEKPQAIECIDSILEVTDGIMVARGDLGVECSLPKLPGYQKLLIHKANLSGKIVITATQMLESMITNAAPTRAEVSDVANACYDGTDAVMLSGESAVGKFPIEAVTMMSEICLEAEKTMRSLEWERIDYDDEEDDEEELDPMRFRYAIAESACGCAETVLAKGIIFFCEQFEVAIYLAKLRPSCPIFVVSFDPKITLATQGLYGCHGMYISEGSESFATTDAFMRAIERNIFKYAGKSFEEAEVVFCAHRSQFPSIHNTIRMARLGKAY